MQSILSSVPLMLRIAKYYTSEFLVYPLESLSLIMRRLFEVGLLLYFWHIVSQENQIVGVDIVPYILIATGVQYFTLGHNFRQASEISKDIKNGLLNNLLIKPVDELKYEYATFFGKNFFEYIFSILNILIGILFITNLEPIRFLLFIMSLLSALVIGYSINVMVASAAFWITEVGYLRLVLYFILRVISGLFIPLTFFAGFWGQFLQLAPTAQIAFVPSYILNGDNLGRAFFLYIVGIFHAIVMFILARKLWQLGIKKYEAIGI